MSKVKYPYLKAMKLVACRTGLGSDLNFSCSAICNAVGKRCYDPEVQQVKAYEHLFKPKLSYDCFWLNEAHTNGLIDPIDTDNWRILALGFMHAITTQTTTSPTNSCKETSCSRCW